MDTINVLIAIAGVLVALCIGLLGVFVTVAGAAVGYIINTINKTIESGFKKSEENDEKLRDENKETKKLIDTAKQELRDEIKDAKEENNKAVHKVEAEMHLRREDVISIHQKIESNIDRVTDKIDKVQERI